MIFNQQNPNGTLGIPLTATFDVPRVGSAPYPAVVIMAGTAGRDTRNRDYAYFLNSVGIATLQVDMYGTRGIYTGGTIAARLPTTEVVKDAFGALYWACEQAKTSTGTPLLDCNRIGIQGFSIGGTACMNTASSYYASHYNYQFAAHGCVYPLLYRYNNQSWPDYPFQSTTGRAIEIHIGDHDNYDSTPTWTVDQSISRFYNSLPRSVYSTIDLTVYLNSTHAFDRQTPPPVPAVDKDACLGGGCLAPLQFNPITMNKSISDMVKFFKYEFGLL